MLTKQYVAEVFSLLQQGDLEGYFQRYVDENVQWTITGTNVLAGTYTSRQDFLDQVIAAVKNALQDGSIKMTIQHVFVDGDTAIVEMQSIAQSKKGHAYDNQYVWIQRFDAGKIVEARVYYDDVLVNKTIDPIR